MIIGVDGRELQGRPTGTGRYLRSILRHWAREGRDRLIVYVSGPLGSAPLADETITWRAIGDGRTHGLVWEQILLPRAARADGLDVFFAPAYQCPLALRLPRVVTVHDLSFFALPQDFSFAHGLRRRLLVAASMRSAAAVIACSRFTRREILGRFPWAAGRVFDVAEGADEDLLPPLPRHQARQRLGQSGPLILHVGSVFNRRCLPELLAAIARLIRRWPDLTLDVVGDNRTHPRLDLASLARSLGVSAHVRFSGFISEQDLALRYSAADAAVLLSEYEGFGLPAVEALSRGVPLVAGDRPSVNVVAGAAAVLVDPRDSRAIAAALSRVLSEPGLAADLAARGTELAARYYWAETARRTREILSAACVSRAS